MSFLAVSTGISVIIRMILQSTSEVVFTKRKLCYFICSMEFPPRAQIHLALLPQFNVSANHIVSRCFQLSTLLNLPLILTNNLYVTHNNRKNWIKLLNSEPEIQILKQVN
jgi:hypothetical protein